MELEKIITMNGQNITIGDIILHMATSPYFRYSFIRRPNKDYLGHPFSEFAIYENPRNVINHFIEPIGEEKFIITGTQNERTKEYYNVYVNGELFGPACPVAKNCAIAMAEMDKLMDKHLHALDDLTFKHIGQYEVKQFGNSIDVYYRQKWKFCISKDKYGNWRLDRPKITPVHPYHIPLSPQCVTNLLNRQAR